MNSLNYQLVVKVLTLGMQLIKSFNTQLLVRLGFWQHPPQQPHMCLLDESSVPATPPTCACVSWHSWALYYNGRLCACVSWLHNQACPPLRYNDRLCACVSWQSSVPTTVLQRPPLHACESWMVVKRASDCAMTACVCMCLLDGSEAFQPLCYNGRHVSLQYSK